MRPPILTTLLLGTALGCSSTTPPLIDCEGKCDLPSELQEDEELDSPCAILTDQSGRGFLPSRLANDPFVSNVYMDESNGCPVDMANIMAVLEETDDSGCSGRSGGLKSRVVSETAQLLGQEPDTFYRSVTSRRCGGRQEFGLLFSNAGLDPETSDMPGGVEVIAFDDTAGVFNYYKEVQGEMQFFGSSHDYILEGPGGPGLTDVRGCANCHTGGGLIMKELEAPWLHWEAGSTTTPGASDIISKRKEFFGAQADGINLETTVVKPGNRVWNKTRVELLRDAELSSVAFMLEPLFCPTEVNLRTGSASRLTSDFILDPKLRGIAGNTSVTYSSGQYRDLLEAIGSSVPGTDEPDTVKPFTFLERSEADQDYVDELIRRGIIDREFVQDVLMLDFTRPVLSDDRCNVVDFAPELDTNDRTADKIRDGFLDNLRQFDLTDLPAAAEFQAMLEAREANGDPNHGEVLGSFFDACRQRQQSETIEVDGDDMSAFLADLLKLRSLQRKLINEDADLCADDPDLSTRSCLDSADGFAEQSKPIFEFAETMAFDKVRPTRSAQKDELLAIHPQARLDPKTCELATDYVTTVGAQSSGDPETSCEIRGCGNFQPGASCQCNEICVGAGDCCPDFESLCQ